jgi:hypothetical protein
MESSFQQKQTDVQSAVVAAPAFHMPDATSSMKDALHRALAYCGELLKVGSPEEALEQVRKGDKVAKDYCHYRLAQEVAATLGALDENVQSVSLFEFEATADDLVFGERAGSLPIHLIVLAERKTSALTSLVSALDHALVKDYAETVGPRRLRHVLDVQVIDNADVENQRGAAALLFSLHNRPMRLWQR